MSTICCPKSIKGLAIRVTRADICCVPEPETTANSRIATNGFVSLSLSPNIETGESISIKLADGSLCIDDTDPDLLTSIGLELLVCGVPLPLLEMLLGVALLLDGVDAVGGVLPSKANQTSAASAETRQFELWSRNKDVSACVAGNSELPYVHWLLPCTKNWQISGNIEFAIGATEITLSGVAEEGGPSWAPSVAAEWSNGQITEIQGGGPLAWKCDSTLPETDQCAYVSAASGS